MISKNKSATERIISFCGEYSFILVFVAIFIVYAITTNGLTWSGMMNVFRHSAVIGIIGLGMGLICITGEIDLSVGSMLALDGGFSVMVFNLTDSIFLSFVFAILFGAFCGLVNGVMVGWIQMPAFIVTLAPMLIYRSFAHAVGSNLKGAHMAGINTAAVKISVFVIAGGLVGLAAFLWIAMNASADPATTGNSYEMYAIAAAVLGGISMSGGKGKCLGILFGAMSYTIIDKIIISLKMDSLINNAIKGIILLLVIMVQIVGPQIKQRLKKAD